MYEQLTNPFHTNIDPQQVNESTAIMMLMMMMNKTVTTTALTTNKQTELNNEEA